MKKILIILSLSFLLVACGGRGTAAYEEKVKLYQSYWLAIQDQTKYKTASDNFSIAAEIALDGDKYRYDVIVDKARVAMYDVEILVLENDDPYHDEKMMPSLGVFNDDEYHMIPNQARSESPYQSGFKLSGDTDDKGLTLHIMVSWKNYNRSTTFKEYFEMKPTSIN